MRAFMISKSIRRVSAYRKPILVAGIVAVIMGIFVAGGLVYGSGPNEPAKASLPASSEIEVLSEEIKQLVTELEYSDKVAEDFVKMVISWKDAQGEPVLVAWKQKLNEASQDYKQAKISKAQLAKLEENIVKELSQRIQKEISVDFGEKFFDLPDVIKNRQGHCLGYSQLVYILGNSVGLSVKPTSVVELMTGVLSTGHVACIAGLPDSKVIMIDLSVFPNMLISKPFELKKEFTKIGNYWELKDKDNPLGIHRRIQILDRNGLIAGIYNNRGDAYDNLGQHTKAISYYNKAIELNPKFAEAYCSRGIAYGSSGQHTKAISDFNKAIELNPNDAGVYNNRGIVYDELGQYTQAISDYTKAIELNPRLADAYNNRGLTYYNLGQFNQAMSDYNKAIEVNPKYAKAYYNRGLAYGKSGQHIIAISDLNKAIEVNPKFAEAYKDRGVAYAFLEKTEEAKKDLLKAVELNPALKARVKRISEQFKLGLNLD
jgi:tetratricopeptide (TPR) repeat protein